MAVQYHGTAEQAWQNTGRFCAQPDKNAPLQYAQKELEARNLVMDFRMDIKAPDRNMAINQINGPSAQMLAANDRNWIKNRIEEIWKETDPNLASEMTEITDHPGFSTCQAVVWLIMVLLSGCICLCCCICHYSSVQNEKNRNYGRKAVEWDNKFIAKLKTFIHDELKSKYPRLAFSIIYPVNIYQTQITVTTRDGRQVGPQTRAEIIQHIFLYVRVSNGAPPPGDSYEPMVDSTAGGQSVTLVVGGQ